MSTGAWDRGREVLEHLPLSWPRWMTATRAASAVLAVGAATTTMLLTAWIPANGLAQGALIGASVSMSTLLARWSCDAPTSSRAVRRAMFAGALHAAFCGALLAPLFVALAERGDAHSPTIVEYLAFAVGATVFGAPIGGALGLAYSFVPAVAARVRARPSHGDVDRVLTVGGLWLLAVAAVHVALLSVLVDPVGRVSDLPLTALWVTPLATGTLLLLAIVTRLTQRSRFLAAARTGEDARFRIATRVGDEASEGVLPLMDDVDPEACGSVLVRIGEPAREVMYREHAPPEVEERVVALLP